MEQQAYRCRRCDSRFVITPLEVIKLPSGKIGFCPFCGEVSPAHVKPEDLDSKQLEFAVAGLR